MAWDITVPLHQFIGTKKDEIMLLGAPVIKGKAHGSSVVC